MHKVILLATALTLSACGKKDENKTAGGGAAKPATGDVAKPAGTTAAAGGDEQWTCDKILPQSLRDKYFKDWKIENGHSVVKWQGKCEVTPPKKDENDIVVSSSLDASCHKNNTLAKAEVLKKLPETFKDMKPIDGVPESLAHKPNESMYQFTAYGAGDCVVNGTLTNDRIDGPAFVKDWIAALPPK